MFGAKAVIELAFAHARSQPARLLLTCLAIMASSAAVAWVVSGYDQLGAKFDDNSHQFLGRYDLLLLPSNVPFGRVVPLDVELIEALRQDPAIREVAPVGQYRVTVSATDNADGAASAIDMLVGSRPPVNGAPPLDPVLVATDAEEGPYELVAGRWLSGDVARSEAVVSSGAAAKLGLDVGDDVLITSISNRLVLRVVGITQQPPDVPSIELEGANATEVESTPATDAMDVPTGVVNTPATEAIYVRPATAAAINGFRTQFYLAHIDLRDGVTVDAFRRAWARQLDAETPALAIVDFAGVKAGMQASEAVAGQLTQAYAATGMATLASVFIIFTTLGMGVSERKREIALLRSIGFTRSQLALLIVLEAVSLALLGWLGGLLAGQLLLWIAFGVIPEALLGWTCIWLSGASVLLGSLAAAVIPAWQAMRVRPLDAFAEQPTTEAGRWPFVCLGLGVLLLHLAPVMVYSLSVGNASRAAMYAAVGYPAMMLGTVLLAPSLLLACQRYLLPAIARLLGVPVELAQTQLSANLFRSLGGILSMTAGLALFASTQIWGHTMLQHYIPGDWLPDALVAFQPLGLDDRNVAAIDDVPGIESGRTLPLMVEQARFGWPVGEEPGSLRRDNAVVVGLDPTRALLGDDPLLDLTFVEGERRTVAKQLAEGNNCVVPDDFTTLTGLKVGDTIPFTPPTRPGQIVEYKIVGIVTMPGWQWVTKFSGVRRRFVRTFTVVIADYEQVKRDFDVWRNEMFWVDLDGSQPLQSVELSLQHLAEQQAGETFETDAYGSVTAYRPFARVTATETIREAITMVAYDVIWSMSQLPLVTLVITSLAVANTLLASFRARRWQMGVLRAIGVTRSQLVRVVISEALLIALVAILLSLLFGLVAGWCAVGMSRYSGMFYSPPDVLVPWGSLGVGFLLTLVLALACAAAPAIAAGRTEPVELLRETGANG
jgi:putative ABC transport system permease protein